MTTTAADVDTDLLDAVIAAGPKAEQFLRELRELRDRLVRGPIAAEDRYDLGADLTELAAVLTAVAAQTFHGVTR